MPETYWTKKRRGTAGLTGRTTRVPPKEYWPGLGQLEVDSDRSRNRNRTTTNAKRKPDSYSLEFEFLGHSTTAPTECKNKYGTTATATTNKRGCNDSKSGGADRKTKLQRMLTSPFSAGLDATTTESGEKSTRERNHRQNDGDDDGKQQQQQLQEPQELLQSTPKKLRPRQLQHMRRQSPKRRLVAKAEQTNIDGVVPADLDTDKGRNRPAENTQLHQQQQQRQEQQQNQQQQQQPQQEEQQPRQTQQLSPATLAAAASAAASPSPRRQTQRPKRMLASLFPYNEVGLVPAYIDTEDGRTRRRATSAAAAAAPRRQTQRPKRMLASLFPYNEVGLVPAYIDTEDGRTRRRATQQEQQQQEPPPQPPQPRRHKRIMARLAAFNGFGIKEMVDLDTPEPPAPLSQPCQPHRPKRMPASRTSVHKKEFAMIDKHSNATPSTKAPRKRGRPAKKPAEKQPTHARHGINTKRMHSDRTPFKQEPQEHDSEAAPPKLPFPGRRKRRKRSSLGDETFKNPKQPVSIEFAFGDTVLI